MGDTDVKVMIIPPSIGMVEGWMLEYALGCMYENIQKSECIMSNPIFKDTLRGLEQQSCDDGGILHTIEKDAAV